MALKTCPHCGHSVSDQATKCPACGKDPRYTDSQLEQQEQQHKKKRKTFLIVAVSIVVLAAVICAIVLPNALRYQKGLAFRDTYDYKSAAEVFTSLGSYRNSKKLAQLSMHDYIYAHFTSSDPTSVEYVEKLKEQGYPGADKLAERLYEWQATIDTCADPDTPDVLPKFHNGDPFFFYVTFSGGKPDTTLTYRYKISVESRYSYIDGYEETGTEVYDPSTGDNVWWYGWESFPANTHRYASLELYDESTGELIAEVGWVFTADRTSTQQTYTQAPAAEPKIPEPPDTSDIVIPDVPDYSHILDKYEDDTYTSDTTTQEKPKKQKYVRQYNSETGEWEWTWIDDE